MALLFLVVYFDLVLALFYLVVVTTTTCLPYLSLRRLVTLAFLLGHDVLKGAPQRLDRRELVADRDDGLEVPVQLVDVCQDLLEALFGFRGGRG